MELLVGFGIAAAPIARIMGLGHASMIHYIYSALNAVAWLLHLMVLAAFPEVHHLHEKGPRPGKAKRAPVSLRLVALLPTGALSRASRLAASVMVDLTSLIFVSLFLLRRPAAAALDAAAVLGAVPRNGALSATEVFIVVQAALLVAHVLLAALGHLVAHLHFDFLAHDV